MHRFARHAPLKAVPFPALPVEHRSGPALSQGRIFKLVATAAGEQLSPEALAVVDEMEPEVWYDAQLLESMLSQLEDRDPGLPLSVGRLAHLLLRKELRQMGLGSPANALAALPGIWMHITRGDAGAWRTTLLGPQAARMELEQPHNCRFEEGGIIGLLEVYDATDIAIDHRPCMRDGAPSCVLDIRWSE
jgi:hypothetical protein